MPDKLPPIKNTAGERFAVEDRVAAWLACHLLANIPWPNPHAGSIQSINCQMRQDGWHFDDFVLELNRSGETYYCACSVKSFPVFGPEGATLDFRTGTSYDQRPTAVLSAENAVVPDTEPGGERK